jgi:hypothetical protein
MPAKVATSIHACATGGFTTCCGPLAGWAAADAAASEYVTANETVPIILMSLLSKKSLADAAPLPPKS